MGKRLLFIVVLTLLQLMIYAQDTISLYSRVPNSKPSSKRLKVEMLANGPRVAQVTDPIITVFPAPASNTAVPAIIICPGGGYTRLAVGHEGIDVAKEFNKWGITAFVLQYRLPDDSIMIDNKIGPLQDAQRAIQLVRERAKSWNIDPDRVGIMGFSAGGHLASTLSTHFSQAVIDNPANISLRPDFSILIYPVISFHDSLAHGGSKGNLIGKNPSAADVKNYSNELQVNANTPPAFLVHASDDKTVPPDNSIVYYQALIKNKVKGEMHIYQQGGHGFGMNNTTTSDKWTERLRAWLVASKLLNN